MKIICLLFAVILLVLHVQSQHHEEPQDDPQALNEAQDQAQEEANEMAPGSNMQRIMMCRFQGGTCRYRCERTEIKIGSCVDQNPCCGKA